MKFRIALILAPILLLAGFALAQKPADTVPAKGADVDSKVIEFQKPSYPLDTCPISGEKLGSGRTVPPGLNRRWCWHAGQMTAVSSTTARQCGQIRVAPAEACFVVTLMMPW